MTKWQKQNDGESPRLCISSNHILFNLRTNHRNRLSCCLKISSPRRLANSYVKFERPRSCHWPIVLPESSQDICNNTARYVQQHCKTYAITQWKQTCNKDSAFQFENGQMLATFMNWNLILVNVLKIIKMISSDEGKTFHA